jgi:type I restriction enzyme S subunit
MNDWTSPVDIRPDHLEIVQDILRECLPAGFMVWVFGSRANWTTKDSSDLDLAVEGAGRLDNKAMVGLEVAFEESDLPYTVDMVDLNAVSPEFKRIVEVQRAPMPSADGQETVNRGWHKLTLGDVAHIVMGQSPLGETVSNNQGIALLNGPTEFGSHHPTPVQFTTDPRKFAEPGDILFCVRGSTTGRMNWADQEYAIGRGIAAIRHREESMLQPLVRGVIEIELPELLAQATGSTFPNVSASQLAEIPYPNLDKSEQRAIFQDWFVDFGPVRAKLEGREPYLPPELWDLFPDHLVDSELGEVPEGWTVRSLEQCAELNPSEPMKKGTISPYINMAALPTSGSSPEDAILRAFTSGTRFRNGDTLFARITPCLENGKTAFVQSLLKGVVGWGSTEFIVMRASPPVPPEYSYLLARDGAFREHAIQSMTGTSGRQRIQVDALAPYLLPVPRAEVLARFSSLVSPLFASIELSRKESRSLAAQRDALLPKLVSREVRLGK